LTAGQLCYAASDAALAWYLWTDLEPKIRVCGLQRVYELQCAAVQATAQMQLRGLGFDTAEHARQIAIWEDDLAAAQRDYVALTGEPPPQTPDTMRALITDVAVTVTRKETPRIA